MNWLHAALAAAAAAALACFLCCALRRFRAAALLCFIEWLMAVPLVLAAGGWRWWLGVHIAFWILFGHLLTAFIPKPPPST